MMGFNSQDNEYDLPRILAKPLYFGLLVNIIVPMALLFVCFYLDKNYSMDNHAGTAANSLFYGLAVLSVAQAGLALWWQRKLFQRPMIRGPETFEQDLATGFLRCCRPVFVIIALISLYGYLYFFLTGRFTESAILVLFSFLVFQVVRPRTGFVKKLIARQQEFVERRRYFSG